MAGLELGVRRRSRHSGIHSARQQGLRAVCIRSLAALFAAYDAKLPWFGTARGRFGYSVGSTLFYATGGLAYGNIKTRVNSTLFGVTNNVEFSDIKGGWTVGGGIETPFTLLGLFGPNWTSKSEYLYVDLGSSSGSLSIPIVGAATITADAPGFRSTSSAPG